MTEEKNTALESAITRRRRLAEELLLRQGMSQQVTLTPEPVQAQARRAWSWACFVSEELEAQECAFHREESE